MEAFYKTKKYLQRLIGNYSIVCEAHKAVIWGVLIKHSSWFKKQRTQQLNSILDDLQQLKTRHKQSLSPSLKTDLFTQVHKLTICCISRPKRPCKYVGKFHMNWPTNGKMLARSRREQRLATYIPHILPPKGTRISEPHIAWELQKFYASLYNIDKEPLTQESIQSYLTSS